MFIIIIVSFSIIIALFIADLAVLWVAQTENDVAHL